MDCKNCKTSLTNESDYCLKCGGKVIRNRLTLKALFTHFSEQFLNYDNKFLQTFLHLFTKPELVIDGYINGTRKRYVNVISYFMIAITFAGIQLLILRKFFPHFFDYSSSTVSEGQNQIMNTISNFNQNYQSLIMVLAIPIMALVSKLVFSSNKKYNYSEQLIIYLYTFAQYTIVSFFPFLIIAFFGISILKISPYPEIVQVLYIAYVLKKLYALNLKQIILKTFRFIIIGFVFYIIIVILVGTIYFTYMYVNGDLQGFLESIKPNP